MCLSLRIIKSFIRKLSTFSPFPFLGTSGGATRCCSPGLVVTGTVYAGNAAPVDMEKLPVFTWLL